MQLAYIIPRPRTVDTGGLCAPYGEHYELWFFWRTWRGQPQLVRHLKLVRDGT